MMAACRLCQFLSFPVKLLLEAELTLGLSSCVISAPMGVDPDAGRTDAALGSSEADVTSRWAPSRVPPLSILHCLVTERHDQRRMAFTLTRKCASRLAFQRRSLPLIHPS